MTEVWPELAITEANSSVAFAIALFDIRGTESVTLLSAIYSPLL